MNPSARTTADRIGELAAIHAQSLRPAEELAASKQHGRGKLTARERIAMLVDPGSFTELDQLVRARAGTRTYGDGVITGHATIDGRPVCLFAQDFTVFGGSMGEAFGEKVLKVMDLALKIGCPVIGLNDSGGARIQEGVVSLAYYAELGRRNAIASGVIPQLSLIMGPCAGGAVYAPAITDFIVMVDKTSHMFVTGPDVVREVTGEQTSFEELGGALTNSTVSGNAHYLAGDEKEAVAWVQDLLAFLPSNNMEDPPAYPGYAEPGPPELLAELDRIVPDSVNQVYDMYEVARRVVDGGELLEIQPQFAPNMICAMARIEGHSVGVVANQPRHNAGTIDIDASEKAARFVRFCDSFNIPLLTLADVPGYLPGVEQERRGIIRRGAKLIYAYSEATVPMVTVIIRKAYGGGYAVMGSKHLGADVNLAWPTAQIAVMGATGAVALLHRKELAGLGSAEAARLREQLVADYERSTATPYVAAERGYVDAVIQPARTRAHVAAALRVLRTKRETRPAKKHDNIPL